jgi:signal peptidase II
MSYPTHLTASNVPEKVSTNKPEKAVSLAAQDQSQVSLLPIVIFFTITIGGFVLDCWSKFVIFKRYGWPGPVEDIHYFIHNFFAIETSVNHGAVFGLGQGYRWVFVCLSFVALGVILYFAFFRRPKLEPFLFYTLAMVSAGILGNLYDRMGLHHFAGLDPDHYYGVRDWIRFEFHFIPLEMFKPWPNFNIADCFLVVGACILGWYSFRADMESSATTK